MQVLIVGQGEQKGYSRRLSQRYRVKCPERRLTTFKGEEFALSSLAYVAGLFEAEHKVIKPLNNDVRSIELHGHDFPAVHHARFHRLFMLNSDCGVVE